MSDITMCVSKTCSKRNFCKRSTTTPSPYHQSYADFTPLYEGMECEDFIPNEFNLTEKKE